MFLVVQDFDFCQNLIKFYQSFPTLPYLSIFDQILPKSTNFFPKLAYILPKFARRYGYIPSSYAYDEETEM